MGRESRGANFCVKDDYYPNGSAKGHGFTPYEAWFNALINAGFTKYLAHDLTLERLGVEDAPN